MHVNTIISEPAVKIKCNAKGTMRCYEAVQVFQISLPVKSYAKRKYTRKYEFCIEKDDVITRCEHCRTL